MSNTPDEQKALERSAVCCRRQEVKVKAELNAMKTKAFKMYKDLEHLHNAAKDARIDAEAALFKHLQEKWKDDK